jgi:DNA-binding CsgD family transcriptional regulator
MIGSADHGRSTPPVLGIPDSWGLWECGWSEGWPSERAGSRADRPYPRGVVSTRAAVERIERICAAETDATMLRVRILDELRRTLDFDAYAWLLTDPDSWVGAAPLAQTPRLGDLPRLIRLKYLTPTNRWTVLPVGATSLLGATGGDPSRSRVWRELLHEYGLVDMASMVFHDSYGCWGFLDLWRIGAHRNRFTAGELGWLGDLGAVITTALRRCQAVTFRTAPGPGDLSAVAVDPTGHRGPVVLLLSPDLEVLTQTAETDAYLRTLLPPDGAASPVPAAAYNVAAQLLAVEAGVDDHPATARAHLSGGRWITLRAGRLPGAPEGRSPIAVSIEPTPPADRAALFALCAGLSPRESEILRQLVAGADTHALAARLFLSEYTIQDHLKSIFVKTGCRTRLELIAHATGG